MGFEDRLQYAMRAAGWLVSDYTLIPEGIRVWVTGGDKGWSDRMIDGTVDALCAYLEVGDPMPGEPEGSGSEHTLIPLEF